MWSDATLPSCGSQEYFVQPHCHTFSVGRTPCSMRHLDFTHVGQEISKVVPSAAYWTG